jgi:hypothetical protein
VRADVDKVYRVVPFRLLGSVFAPHIHPSLEKFLLLSLERGYLYEIGMSQAPCPATRDSLPHAPCPFPFEFVPSTRP